MKAMATAKYVITLVGVGMLVGAFLFFRSTSSFIAEATKAEGTVVELEESRTSDSTFYSPVVQFTSLNGRVIEFVSSASSNPPTYSKGQKVEVLYLPADPKHAKINGFFPLWGGSAVLGGMGSVFFSIGAGIILAGALKCRKDDYLKNHGTPIETDYHSVELNTAISVNGSYPFRVVTQWQNPWTSELHVFKSNSIWFDPSSYIQSNKITVFIEKGNPRHYYVDLSFLPKLAE
ncbi:DUF3592 domain-containing protein [Synechococcus sp. MW101C3]|uniref:DUF3592 domain-containing protein n=1 Tax=Synechococcus sp. MW101C3 TaxID=210768 RepID=UPI000B995665|nr:DUF3592 domain-containing protein [Synechococcus sp. MW101C3]